MRSMADLAPRLRAAVRRLLPHRLLELLDEHRVQQTLACSRLLTTPWRFVARELRGAPGVHSYALRRGGTVCLHHRSPDLGILDEVFRLGWYTLPDAARARLAALDRPLRVADLGAHVGTFGVWAVTEFPAAEITAFEPDPQNLEALRCAVSANRAGDRWRVVDACAAAADGTLSFAAYRSSGSHVVDGDAPGALQLVARDVFPELHRADLVKIDIEGSEWPILTDDRFPELAAPVLVLEYHPEQCPTATPRATAEQLLRDAGYDTFDIWHDPAGVGMLWAVKRAPAPAA